MFIERVIKGDLLGQSIIGPRLDVEVGDLSGCPRRAVLLACGGDGPRVGHHGLVVGVRPVVGGGARAGVIARILVDRIRLTKITNLVN